jgi:hypothetical protein
VRRAHQVFGATRGPICIPFDGSLSNMFSSYAHQVRIVERAAAYAKGSATRCLVWGR